VVLQLCKLTDNRTNTTHFQQLSNELDITGSFLDIGDNWIYLDFLSFVHREIGLFKRFDTAVSSSEIGDN